MPANGKGSERAEQVLRPALDKKLASPEEIAARHIAKQLDPRFKRIEEELGSISREIRKINSRIDEQNKSSTPRMIFAGVVSAVLAALIVGFASALFP